MVSREEQDFPTRHLLDSSGGYRGAVEAERAEAGFQLDPTRIHRCVMGLDGFPKPMEPAEVERLRDPFAELLLKRGNFPTSLRALLGGFDAFNDDSEGLPDQASYVVAEGGEIPWTPETSSLNRGFRFAIARGRGPEVMVLISASTVIDSEEHFLQVLGWDPENWVYQYYERRSGTWLWAGDSNHALEPLTRGKGPFDSHVNGSLVMKELKIPWTHWHSMSAGIQEDALAPDDPLRTEPLFTQRTGAEDLELRAVRPGITRWDEARLEKSIAADGTISDVHLFMRQVLETTTVNLASSRQQSRLVREDSTLVLPTTFFLDADALLDEITLEPQLEPIGVEGRLYLESLERYDFTLVDEGGTAWQKGDTFFAFLVPEPAFEDLDVLSQLLKRKILTPRFAACLLMVDFPNPVFSTRRQHLMRYVPDQTRLTDGGSDLPLTMVAAIEEAMPDPPPGSPEGEFLANWRLPETEWKAAFERRIERYFEALRARANTEEGFDRWVRLADSRRREFRRRPLAEFGLTLPTTNIPKDAPFLEMSENGTVRETQRRPT